jgi:hypothetical protein
MNGGGFPVLGKRISVTTGAIAAVAFPAAGLADVGDNGGKRADRAERTKAAALQRPTKRFHESIDVHVERIRAEQRRRREEQFAALPGGVSEATLEAIAACESGGDPTAVSADGTYRGKYQFDYGTWASVGGSGDPAAAPEAEQDYRAALLYAQAGSSPWPICGV